MNSNLLLSETNEEKNLNQTTENTKLKLLNDEIKILDETNKKFIEENKDLISKVKKNDFEIINLKKIIKQQKIEIDRNKIDQTELEFLRLNLIHSSKCRKSAFKKGFKVGTPEYKQCILSKGTN